MGIKIFGRGMRRIALAAMSARVGYFKTTREDHRNGNLYWYPSTEGTSL
jgi:hypothetical protein